jgi:hypothetical protein
MSDIRKDVEEAITEHTWATILEEVGGIEGESGAAVAAIAAATPHIRAALFDELIQASAGSFVAAGERLVILGEELEFASIEDWLEFRKEQDQP